MHTFESSQGILFGCAGHPDLHCNKKLKPLIMSGIVINQLCKPTAEITESFSDIGYCNTSLWRQSESVIILRVVIMI